MAYFKITEPNKNPKWIKSIDRANGTLEFSENRDGCFQQDSGFFADSEFAYLMFHFKEAYPELQHMTIDTSWHAQNAEHGYEVLEGPQPWDDLDAVQEGPQAPIELHNGQELVEAYNGNAVEANVEAEA